MAPTTILTAAAFLTGLGIGAGISHRRQATLRMDVDTLNRKLDTFLRADTQGALDEVGPLRPDSGWDPATVSGIPLFDQDAEPTPPADPGLWGR